MDGNLQHITLLFNGKSKKPANDYLHTINIDGHDLHFFDANSPKSLLLLTKAYKEVYEPAFPIDDERESIECWLEAIKDKASEIDMTICIIADDINSENPKIKGISVGHYYNKYNVGLLSYNAIAPEYRRLGLAKIMADARRHAFLGLANKGGKDLDGVFVDCNNPEKVKPEDDSFDPAKRIEIFKKFGARLVPIDYVQPPLEADLDKCYLLQLFAYPHPKTGKYPKPAAVKAFIDGIYRHSAKATGIAPHNDFDYIKTIKQIRALPANYMEEPQNLQQNPAKSTKNKLKISFGR